MERNIEYTPEQEKHIKKTFGLFHEAVEDFLDRSAAKFLKAGLRLESKERSTRVVAKALMLTAAYQASKNVGTIELCNLWNMSEGQRNAAIVGSALFGHSSSRFAELYEATHLASVYHKEAHDAYLKAHDEYQQS